MLTVGNILFIVDDRRIEKELALGCTNKGKTRQNAAKKWATFWQNSCTTCAVNWEIIVDIHILWRENPYVRDRPVRILCRCFAMCWKDINYVPGCGRLVQTTRAKLLALCNNCSMCKNKRMNAWTPECVKAFTISMLLSVRIVCAHNGHNSNGMGATTATVTIRTSRPSITLLQFHRFTNVHIHRLTISMNSYALVYIVQIWGYLNHDVSRHLFSL